MILLMQLACSVREEVSKDGRHHQTEEALVWIARLHGLAHQALASTHPSYDALNTAYFLKTASFRAEESLWQQTGNRERAVQVRERRAHFEQFWSTQIQPAIQAVWHTVDAPLSGKNKQPGLEDSEHREEIHAHALVRLITANLPL
jgi:hypothetical protein